MAKRPSIFCLEGEWSSNLMQRMSVEPILDLLDHLGLATSVHRDVATVEELEYYVAKLDEKRYDDFKVVYLAMHGDSGLLKLGKDTVDLDDLQRVLAKRCVGRIVYFGSCLTMKMQKARLQEFARVTGARAVVGYRKEVGWLESAAFEVLLLDRMVSGVRSDALFNRLSTEHGKFAKSLGLVVATRSQVHWTPLRESSRGA